MANAPTLRKAGPEKKAPKAYLRSGSPRGPLKGQGTESARGSWARPHEPPFPRDVRPTSGEKGESGSRTGRKRPRPGARGPDDDLVLAPAIAAWEAERNPGLGFSYSYGVSEMRVF